MQPPAACIALCDITEAGWLAQPLVSSPATRAQKMQRPFVLMLLTTHSWQAHGSPSGLPTPCSTPPATMLAQDCKVCTCTRPCLTSTPPQCFAHMVPRSVKYACESGSSATATKGSDQHNRNKPSPPGSVSMGTACGAQSGGSRQCALAAAVAQQASS
jgi:hypothetical protein